MAFNVRDETKREAYRKHMAQRAERSAHLRARIVAKIAEGDPDGFWADMLADHDEREE